MGFSRWRQYGLILFALSFNTGCTLQMAYKWADWLVEWQVEKHIDLTKPQTKALAQAVKRVREQIAVQQLPIYIQDIAQLSQQLQTGALTAQQWQDWMVRLEDNQINLIQQLLPELIPLLQSLSDQQIESLLDSLEQEHRRMMNKIDQQPLAKQRLKTQKKTEKLFKKWLGSLTAGQSEQIAIYLSSRISTRQDWLDYRQAWFSELSQIFTLRQDTVKFKQALTGLLLQPNAFKTVEYQAKQQRNLTLFATSLSMISLDLNTKQKQHLQRKTQNLTFELEQLHQRARNQISHAKNNLTFIPII